ncbi:MAG: hypothetical protein JXA87_15745 [Thermoleophilia bacterium]|nr:hypothetical protein [Thermoleophilia bacterium]
MLIDGCKRLPGLLMAAATLLTIGLVVVIASGCGDDQKVISSTSTAAAALQPTSGSIPPATPAAPSTTAATAPATTAATAPATTTVTAPATGPAGEIGAVVSVSSTNGAYPADAAPDWSQIESAEAYRDASYGVATIWVSLATYEVTAADIFEYWDLPYPAAGQGRIELGLTRTLLDTNEPPLVTGTYDLATPQGKAELTGWAKIVLPGGTAVAFDTSAVESDVQITALSDTQISGTFFVKDKWSDISGTFTAPVK